MGIGLIDPWQGLAALETAVLPSASQVVAFWLVRWDIMLLDQPQVLQVPSVQCNENKSVNLEALLYMVRRTAGTAVDADTTLIDAGIDSLGAVELINQLHNAVGNVVGPPSTIVSDHPTPRALSVAVQAVQRLAAATVLDACETPATGDTLEKSINLIRGRGLGMDDVVDMIRRATGIDADADISLMDAGLDSVCGCRVEQSTSEKHGCQCAALKLATDRPPNWATNSNSTPIPCSGAGRQSLLKHHADECATCCICILRNTATRSRGTKHTLR